MSTAGPGAGATERCAARAQRRDDEMLGTAFPAARLLLVEEPFPWGFEGLRSSRADRDAVLALEARARAVGVRVQAIRRPGRSHRGVRRRWALVDTRTRTSEVRWGEFADDAELAELPLDGAGGEPDPAPLFLVCTHGRHDPCCAQRGRPLVAALSAIAPDRVWQASHLGGCRFAATVLVLPLGLMYGRVPPSAAAELVAATAAGEVRGAWLRGRVGVAPATQAALAFAHEQLGRPRSRDLTVVSSAAIDDGSVRVELDAPGGRVAVSVRRTRVDAPGLTCAAPGPSWFVAHRAVAIEPVPAVPGAGPG